MAAIDLTELRHYCANCFAEKVLRCGTCKLVHFCGAACQRANYAEHSKFCTNQERRTNWKAAMNQLLADDEASSSSVATDFKTLSGHLNLLEPWSKRALCSSGYLELLLNATKTQRYAKESQSYNYRLVVLIDALRAPDGQSIDADLCFVFVFALNGPATVLQLLVEHTQLHYNQKLSVLRFMRLLAAHPKLQPVLIDQLETLLPLVSRAASVAGSTEIVAELGVFVASMLYGAYSPAQHGQLQILCGQHLDLKCWMDCAFGDSAASNNMEQGAVELLLALLIDDELFPEYDDMFRSHFIEKYLLIYPALLKSLVFGFLDLLMVPKSVFFAAALHALALLFSNERVLEQVMKNMWLLTDAYSDDEEDAPATDSDSPLRQMIAILTAPSDPVVQLTYFQTNTHVSILTILEDVLRSPYCNIHFVEAAVGKDFLGNAIQALEVRYHQAVQDAQRYKVANRMAEPVGNETELESILQQIQVVNSVLASLPEDIHSINQAQMDLS